MTEPNFIPERVQAVIQHAVAGLDPADRADRVAYCQQHDEHGVRMFPGDQDDLLEFRWGGRTLALVHRDVLTDPNTRQVHTTFIAETPDTLPDDWSTQ